LAPMPGAPKNQLLGGQLVKLVIFHFGRRKIYEEKFGFFIGYAYILSNSCEDSMKDSTFFVVSL
ncbi:hypothetical protein, partial [Aerococcus sp. HMSC10H05]|uniref:hypothetical protein n=1 Tax=Aerococcus sp. HMSC10H05 TaxID=1581084 RepID=UPI001AEFA742